jgi:hypothetical protein
MSKAQTVAIVKPVQSVKELDKLFASISNNRKALQTQMHTAAVSVLWHVAKHSDVRVIDKLFTALQDDKDSAIRMNALIQWLCDFAPVSYEASTKAWSFDRSMSAADTAKRFQAGVKVPFWVHSKEPEYKPLDMAAFIATALKRIQKDEDEMSKAGITVDHSAAKKALLAVQKELQAPQQPVQQPKQQKAPKATPSAAVIASTQKPAQLPLQ